MEDEKGLEQDRPDPPASHDKGTPLFLFMARYPWPFMIVLPAIFALILGFGWTTDDRVEQEVNNLWIAQNGDYAKDKEYMKDLGLGDLGSSAFAALAVARDGGNMLTKDRLEAVRQRMEETENTTVVFKGETFTWDDFCAINSSPYQFPCLRLSPMDLYKEARWTFTTMDRIVWYRGVLQNVLITPRLTRFGFLNTTCASDCQDLFNYRMATNPLKLFADVGDLEYSDECRICLEESYTGTIQMLYGSIMPSFGGLIAKVSAFDSNLPDTEENAAHKAENQRIIANLTSLMNSITTNDVVDFYQYYVTRGLYAQLGAANYLASYQSFAPYIEGCYNVTGLTCPPLASEMTIQMAARDLLAHADNVFSSISTAGAPYPFWSEGDGSGILFFANEETGGLLPISGSGIDMSGSLFSLGAYIMSNETNGDVTSDDWATLVEINPIYAWFMASLTPAEEGTVCGNEDLPGNPFDPRTVELLAANTPRWCTPFDVPNPSNPGPVPIYSKQHFARMWYDLLIASENFLDVTQGQDDPYSWTTGAGCDYDLAGERYSFTDAIEQDILSNSSRLVYNIDEGVTLGPMDPHLLLGGVTPTHDKYNFSNPLTQVTILQNLYGSLLPRDIVNRLKNCNRPGGPVDLSEDDAAELLEIWKEAMENTWNRGWDDENDGEVQFVSFFDDGGVIGSTGRMLTEITLDNSTLTTISILVIALFSAIFMFSVDIVDSRVMLALIGVALVVLSFFAALGFGLLTGVKINVTIAWTLPFVIIGLGVDDVYIIMNALKKQPGYSLEHWLAAMHEIVVPVTMTSLVNACMFAILNVSDIPAIYLTSRVALYCVIALYLSVVFCYPAYCYLDCIRQQNNRADVCFCVKNSETRENTAEKEDFRNVILFDKFYKPVVLGTNGLRYLSHAVIVLASLAVFAVGCYGITERSVGLGLADFFPDDNPAGEWARISTEVVSAWNIAMNWGALDYNDPDTQLRMIKQFEDVVGNKRVSEVDTKQLWMAEFLLWTSRHCDENFARPDFNQPLCGRDQAYPEEEDSYCAGSWADNKYNLRLKAFATYMDDQCVANEGGICRLGEDMHPYDLEEFGVTKEQAAGRQFCPVIADWSDAKFEFCVNTWRKLTGGSGRLLTKPGTGTPGTCTNQDAEIEWPIPYSYGPVLYSYDVFTHEDTLDMMEETRAVCDDVKDVHCWMSGIPFDYWTQYVTISEVLLELCGFATLAGFVVSFVFLYVGISVDGNHSACNIFVGTLIGAGLIAGTIIMTLCTVIGLSILSDVNLTGFSNMSFVLSVGFTVEYTVHIVSRWLRASSAHSTSLERVEHTMSFLMLPTFMSFVSSTIGTICLAFTEFDFNRTYFFRPLMIVMFISYWFGCWFLPTVLVYLDFGFVKLGPEESDDADTPVKSIEGKEEIALEKGDSVSSHGEPNEGQDAQPEAEPTNEDQD